MCKKTIYFLIAVIIFNFIGLNALSQVEICDNCLDDDGDGLVDIWDLDDCPCIEGSSINDCPSGCTYDLPVVPYQPQLLWSAQNVDARETPLVGDVDNDGIPDVVYDDYRNPGNIYIVDGITGNTKYTINTGLDLTQNNSANGIADTDKDGYAEIYVPDDARRLSRFDFDGATWTITWTTTYFLENDQHMPAFADFNADGNPEIYFGNMIVNPVDGSLILNGAGTIPYDGQSVAIDMLPDATCANCNGLELVVGGQVFVVDINTATVTLQVSLNLANDGDGFGPTSVADVDNDGDFDIVYTSRGTGNIANLIVWDGQTDNLLMPNYETPPGLSGSTSSIAGRVNIADFDGDGFLEFGYCGREIYQVIDDVFSAGAPTEIWHLLNTDRSAITGSTVFDFENDGAAEVVYRDEDSLYVLKGNDGTVFFSAYCRSGTRYEYPVIADINADGATEIVVTCNTAGVTAFRSGNSPWAPSRKVWNQHAYNVTNVNDDLTIPAIPAFNPSYLDGLFNNFLQQSSPVNAIGAIVLKASDLEILSVYVDPINCGNCINVEFLVSNYGEVSVPNFLPISLYDNDPTATNANLITTVFSENQIAVGDVDKITVCVPYSGDMENAYFVANDPGTLATPYSLTDDFPITGVPECNYLNNIKEVSIVCKDVDNDGFLDFLECFPNNGNSTILPNAACGNNNTNVFEFGN